MKKLIYLEDAIDAAIEAADDWDGGCSKERDRFIRDALEELPSAQPDPCEYADKLKRCKFEYINACKIVAHPTPDTSKNDIYDAYAVMKALHPIFGDEEL